MTQRPTSASTLLKDVADLAALKDEKRLYEGFLQVMRSHWPGLSFTLADQAQPQGVLTLPIRAEADWPRLAVEGDLHDLANGERELLADMARLLGTLLGCIRQEDDVEARRQRDRTIFENSPLGMILYAPDGTILDCNDTLVRLMASSRDRLIGLNAATQTPEPMREALTRALAGEPAVFEDIYTSVTGSKPLYLRARFNPVHPGKPPTEVIATIEDVSRRKRDEERLRASEARFKNLLADMEMVAVQGYDHERRVIFWNQASELLYGYSPEEAMGRRLEDLIIPDAMRDDVIRGVQAWVDGGPAIPSGELELHRKDGSMVPVYSSHVMQENTFGAKEMFCVDVDLSQTRKAMDELMRAKEAAEAANHAKSNFLANMSHEIRTPLNGILGMIQLMRSTQLAPEQDKYTLAALQSALRLTRLLSDILDLTRVEAGKLAIHNEPFELAETFHQVADLFESVSRHSGVDLRTIIDPALPASLNGDQMRLTQVLTNLAGNALKFTSQGSVTMEATALTALRPGQCRVLFRITDTGIGIPERMLDQAFEPFSQGAEGYTRDYQGAGLGLSICKRLVDLMGGNLSIASEKGQGTSVYFTLSFGHDMDAQAASSPVDTEAGPLNILLVEDDQTSSMVTRLLLEKTGHAVHTAYNGQEALRTLRDKTFDVVLMDVQMPVMDGIQATRAIREGQAGQDAATVPVVAMTAFAMTGDRERFLDAGMDGYLAKPVRLEELEAALADATRPPQARPRPGTPRPLPRS